MGTDSARTSRLPVQHWETTASPGCTRNQALLPTATAPKPTSPGRGELQAQCSSNRHHLRSHSTASENYIGIMPWAVKPKGWERRQGAASSLPSQNSAVLPASFHAQRRVWRARERTKLRERVDDREGSADQVQKQLKWDQLHVVEQVTFHSAV